MKTTRIREFIAAVFVLVLIAALVIGVMIAMGKEVPVISGLLGR